MTGSTRLRAYAAPSALVLLVAAVALAGPGTPGVLLLVVLLLALGLTVGLHLRLEPRRGHGRPAEQRPLLRTPTQVALGVTVVVVAGSFAAIVASIVLATVAPSVGDGSLLLRLCLVVCALGPCLSIGYRCGRWWAFLGSAGLAPLLGLCVLIVGPRSWSGLGFVVLAVTAVALAVAAGSLQRAPARTRARRTSTSGGSARRSPTEPQRPATLLIPSTAAARRQARS